MADTFQALASPVRRHILKLLRERDMTAGEIAEHLDVTKPTLSGHFNILKDAKLVVTERSGTTITYSLNLSVAEELITSLYSLLGVKEQAEKAQTKSENPHSVKEHQEREGEA